MQTAKADSDTDEIDDRALMARLQADDEAALGPLMDRWELPTKAVIGRIVLNASEAEELAQETFVRVWQQRDKFRPGATFRPWLFAIAVNLARNRLRWWRRRPTISLQKWSEGHAPTTSRTTPLSAPEADVRTSVTPDAGAAHLEREERAAAVRDAIAALPRELREAIVLFEYEQMSHAEIAEVVGATAKAVETRIYRAKEKLRTALRRVL
ncbi:MAG TPA: sigma-70 family RNA polymerase sigma factor [Opitutaceae bacterium]|nr:sigma-70 family RNA polymerase sigma factor [Opitutaceae bacterium]